MTPTDDTERRARTARWDTIRAYDRMNRSPEFDRAERIASHYLRNAASAQYLLKIVEMVRNGATRTPEVEETVRYISDSLRAAHAADLGIELTWPNTPQEYSHP